MASSKDIQNTNQPNTFLVLALFSLLLSTLQPQDKIISMAYRLFLAQNSPRQAIFLIGRGPQTFEISSSPSLQHLKVPYTGTLTFNATS